MCPKCRKEFDQVTAAPFTIQMNPPNGVIVRTDTNFFRIEARTWMTDRVIFVPFMILWFVLLGIILGNGFHSGVHSGGILLLKLSVHIFLGCFGLWEAAVCIFGKTVIERLGDSVTISRGIGKLGWKTSFSWTLFLMSSVHFGSRRSSIRIEAEKVRNFGKDLTPAQQKFIAHFLLSHKKREEGVHPSVRDWQ